MSDNSTRVQVEIPDSNWDVPAINPQSTKTPELNLIEANDEDERATQEAREAAETHAAEINAIVSADILDNVKERKAQAAADARRRRADRAKMDAAADAEREEAERKYETRKAKEEQASKAVEDTQDPRAQARSAWQAKFYSEYQESNHCTAFFDKQNNQLAWSEPRWGRRIAVHTLSRDVVAGAVQRCKEKGWKSITLKGSPAFKQAAWFEARLNGLRVHGYRPSKEEKILLEKALQNQRAQQQAAENGIEEDRSLSAKFENARDALKRKPASNATPSSTPVSRDPVSKPEVDPIVVATQRALEQAKKLGSQVRQPDAPAVSERAQKAVDVGAQNLIRAAEKPAPEAKPEPVPAVKTTSRFAALAAQAAKNVQVDELGSADAEERAVRDALESHRVPAPGPEPTPAGATLGM